MALLNEEILRDVTQMLAPLTHPVKLVLFTDAHECEYCPQIAQLLHEVAAASPQVSVEEYEIHQAAEKAAALNIQMAPALAIVGEKDYGIRYYGIPSGYEFSTLLHGMVKAGMGHSELDAATKGFLNQLNQPVHLKVFVTPTCPYCPRSAVLAYEMAVESDWVRADVIESAEFEALSMQYEVGGVPLNIINDKGRVEGAAPPQMMIDAIRQALA